MKGVAVLGVLVGLALATASYADAYVYWTNTYSGGIAVSRANLDGSLNDRSFISVPHLDSDGARGVAVDAEHVYWTNDATDTIGRASLDGTHVERRFIAGASDPRYLAVDAGHVYWTNTGTRTIGRADLDGADVDQSFVGSEAGNPYGIAVDAGHVYWTNPGTSWTDVTSSVGRSDIDGHEVDSSWIDGPPPYSPYGERHELQVAGDIDVDARHVYWVNRYEFLIGRSSAESMDGARIPPHREVGAIARAKLDGTAVDHGFLFVKDVPDGIALGAHHVYWGNVYRDVGRARLDGTDLDERFIEDGVASPSGVAVDAIVDTRPPQTRITERAPRRTGKTAVRLRFRSSEANSRFECRLDGRRWESCISPKNVKHLGEGRHTFEVRAVDAAGNVDRTPAGNVFRVKLDG